MTDRPHSFVTTIDLQLAEKLKTGLELQGFEFTLLPHALFSAKKIGLSCTLYQSGKLVVQGKNCPEFIEFYLEPEILKSFAYSHPLAGVDFTARIGIDESGKGDFFGPLCIAGVFVKEDQFEKLHAIGVKDSKTLSDAAIQKIAKEIKKNCLYHIVIINPQKYNQIYSDFKNLNRLLAWGHATTIERLSEDSGCKEVIIDQFADEWVVESAVKKKKLQLHITQRHRGEEDLSVAAASILAREAFLDGLKKIGEEIGFILPKGSSNAVRKIGLEILRKLGLEKLKNVCKNHFKTLEIIIQENL